MHVSVKLEEMTKSAQVQNYWHTWVTFSSLWTPDGFWQVPIWGPAGSRSGGQKGPGRVSLWGPAGFCPWGP
jgi:hypothetical protein